MKKKVFNRIIILCIAVSVGLDQCYSFHGTTGKIQPTIPSDSTFPLRATNQNSDGTEKKLTRAQRFLQTRLKLRKIWNQNIRRKPPGELILVRHGESETNANLTFTGWIDSDITENGRREMKHAGRLLLERGYSDIDLVYTSILKRSIRSSWVLLLEIKQIFRPVFKTWRLNQRMYGAIEGQSYEQVEKEAGPELVDEYRRSIYVRPPPMNADHPNSHFSEQKFKDLNLEGEIPNTESIADVFERTLPTYQQRILPELSKGKRVLVVGHANSLRGLIKHIDNLSPQQVQDVVLPNGIPLIYKFDEDMAPIKQTGSIAPMSGSFLEDPKVLAILLEKEKKWGTPAAMKYQGLYSLVDYSETSAITPLAESLSKLAKERNKMLQKSPEPTELSLERESSKTPVRPVQKSEQISKYVTDLQGPVVVLIRHGKTEFNKLGIFTGWDDADLAEEGRLEARKAGKLLKLHGLTFDIVYTSWLSRAIETAWIVLDELDLLWLPIVKSWRLNERMYGALTAMSKKGIAEKYGDSQMKSWRRGFAVRPPAVDSFSKYYPGNDDRYYQYVKDLPISKFESFIRSLAKGKLQIHRKFPKTESLKDCMSRTIPYYTETIVPESISQGKRTLISSSENAIRGLLMHLCNIPEDRIHEIDIPNGLPLVYSLEKKCIQILDDGLDHPDDLIDPLKRYNFGRSPELLFKPCDFEGESADQCFIGENGRSYAFDPIIRLRLAPESQTESVTVN